MWKYTTVQKFVINTIFLYFWKSLMLTKTAFFVVKYSNIVKYYYYLK